MTVPGRIEAASLLRSLDPPSWLERHSRAVAEVAGFLAATTARRGVALDRRLVEAAALLHDADKALPADDPHRARPHGHGSARWLTERGHAELAGVVAAHPVTRLLDGAWFEEWLATSGPEERIVAYADKRAGQRLESIDARFASWRRRYSTTHVKGRTSAPWSDETLVAVRERAGLLERVVCEAAGIEPGAVRRLPWTAAALRATASTS